MCGSFKTTIHSLSLSLSLGENLIRVTFVVSSDDDLFCACRCSPLHSGDVSGEKKERKGERESERERHEENKASGKVA